MSKNKLVATPKPQEVEVQSTKDQQAQAQNQQAQAQNQHTQAQAQQTQALQTQQQKIQAQTNETSSAFRLYLTNPFKKLIPIKLKRLLITLSKFINLKLNIF